MNAISTSPENEIIKAVRRRFRVCNYLFKASALWFAVGGLVMILSRRDPDGQTIALVIELVGAGIFSVAFALTLAIYRCPACDRYLSRFRPRKDQCPNCNAKIR